MACGALLMASGGRDCVVWVALWRERDVVSGRIARVCAGRVGLGPGTCTCDEQRVRTLCGNTSVRCLGDVSSVMDGSEVE